MCKFVRTYIDFLYKELNENAVEWLTTIPPGLIVLRNSNVNLFEHPHVVIWHKFLLNYFDPSVCDKRYAIIMPCSSVKPYRLSATHRILDSTIYKNRLGDLIQIYVLSEPMILVPRELDIYYPFANYEYPVEELTPRYREKFIELLSCVLPKLRFYSKTIAVLPKHHLSILVESINRSSLDIDIDIINYGKKAFNSIKLAVLKILMHIG